MGESGRSSALSDVGVPAFHRRRLTGCGSLRGSSGGCRVPLQRVSGPRTALSLSPPLAGARPLGAQQLLKKLSLGPKKALKSPAEKFANGLFQICCKHDAW